MTTTRVRTIAALGLFFSLSGCGNDAAGANAILAGPKTDPDIVHVPLFIRDANGQPAMDPATPLYEARKNNPIMAPDGHQVTLSDFNAVGGTATVSCTASGTQATLELHGLIPGATYTAWNVVFEAPGFDPMFTNLIGLGALGPPDGTRNVFRSSAAGEAQISATTPPGPLSMMGSIGACTLTDEFEWHVVGAYHIDGHDHGPQLGPDGSAVEQFGFIFKR